MAVARRVLRSLRDLHQSVAAGRVAVPGATEVGVGPLSPADGAEMPYSRIGVTRGHRDAIVPATERLFYCGELG
jgi:hypothetical protein